MAKKLDREFRQLVSKQVRARDKECFQNAIFTLISIDTSDIT